MLDNAVEVAERIVERHWAVVELDRFTAAWRSDKVMCEEHLACPRCGAINGLEASRCQRCGQHWGGNG